MLANLLRLLLIGLLGTVLWSPAFVWLVFASAFGLVIMTGIFAWFCITGEIDPFPGLFDNQPRKCGGERNSRH